MKRRLFLKTALKAGGTAGAGVVLVPVFIHVLSPAWETRREGTWAAVGPLADLATGAVTLALVSVPRDDWAQSLRKRGVFVWRPAGEELVVYSRSCTDLGCPVTWDPGSSWFFCPCHGAIFNQEGVPQKGPPKKPLHRFRHRVTEGTLEIDLDSVPPSA